MITVLRRIAIFLLILIYLLNCFILPVFAQQTAEEEQESDLPNTGDGLMIRLKLSAVVVIVWASYLILLNYRKCI